MLRRKRRLVGSPRRANNPLGQLVVWSGAWCDVARVCGMGPTGDWRRLRRGGLGVNGTGCRNEPNFYWSSRSCGFRAGRGRGVTRLETVGAELAQSVKSTVVCAVGRDEAALEAIEGALAAAEGVAEHGRLFEALPLLGGLEFHLPDLGLDSA